MLWPGRAGKPFRHGNRFPGGGSCHAPALFGSALWLPPGTEPDDRLSHLEAEGDLRERAEAAPDRYQRVPGERDDSVPRVTHVGRDSRREPLAGFPAVSAGKNAHGKPVRVVGPVRCSVHHAPQAPAYQHVAPPRYLPTQLVSDLGHLLVALRGTYHRYVQRVHLPGVLSLIHISEPTRLGMISYAVF